ncbi:hypothetical protein [Pedobacter steynii]|uniref:Uncharacterized protein n=1 Tax=Pedobacter steynii TaxID=430522 RepID=A0A1D7QMN5_9SPHI|nr:hypothetical protein [Pedobacter steynii]AOM79921.1 hypothetical protein BFS30_23810 [Pedobacter steynii]
MKKTTLLTAMLLLSLAGYAQKSAFVGSYNGTKPEIAQELLILPDHRFLFSLSYGSVDQVLTGSWTEEGGKLSLKEEKTSVDPFLIFGGYNSRLGNGKHFTFKGYADNVSVALSVEDVFDASSFKLLHSRDQSVFSRTNHLDFTAKPVHKFFLSRAVSNAPGEESNQVYAFHPQSEWNDFVLYYSSAADSPPLSLKAELKNDSLFLFEEEREGRYFAVKRELPENLTPEKLDAYFKNSRVPDSLSFPDSTGKVQTYHILRSTEHFKSALTIQDKDAYFKREDEGSALDPIQTNPVGEVTGIAPPKVTAPKNKTRKKSIPKRPL